MSLDVGAGETAVAATPRWLRVVSPAAPARGASRSRRRRARHRDLGCALALVPERDAGPADRVLARTFWARGALAEGRPATVVPLLPLLRARRT